LAVGVGEAGLAVVKYFRPGLDWDIRRRVTLNVTAAGRPNRLRTDIPNRAGRRWQDWFGREAKAGNASLANQPSQSGISSMGREGIGLFFIGKNTLA